MKSSKQFFTVFAAVTFLQAAAAQAAHVDMNDPRRALGREDDVRVDAQLLQNTISSGSAIGVTYQVENLTSAPIAVADKVCDVSFNADDRAVVVSIGSEVPANGEMPKLVTIAPGDKKTFSAGGLVRITSAAGHSRLMPAPRVVQIKVNILRDLAPFQPLIAQQARTSAPVTLSDEQFEKWMESNDTIFLNTIPVSYDGSSHGVTGAADASQPAARGTF